MRALFWLIGVLALLGTPLFAIMGGASELAWLTHPDRRTATCATSRPPCSTSGSPTRRSW